MKYFFNILLLVALATSLYSQNVNIFDVNAENYPLLNAKILALDNNSLPINNLVASDFEIFENGKSRFINSLLCNNLNIDTTVSVIISIDISESMKGERLELAKSASKAIIETMDLLNNECAIQTFNEQNYINQDFTNQKSKLFLAIDNIQSQGGTNFNASFIDLPAGSLRIAKNSTWKPIIIVITDGIADGNEQEIIDSVSISNVEIYSVTLGTETPKILKNISEISGGISFDNIQDELDIQEIFKTILRLSQGIEPCEISWISDDCEGFREIEVKLRNTTLNDFSYYRVPFNRFAGFDYVDNNYLEFGKIAPGNQPVKYIRLTAKNQDIRINSIESDNPLFKILGFSNGTLIEKNNSIQFGIQFSPENEEYTTAEFTIDSDICFGEYFYASGGDKFNIGEKKLKIDFPNGGEIFAADSDTLIKWSGLIPSDKVELQYSADNGIFWNTIADSATGLQYVWNDLPKTPGDKYLVKAIQYSQDYDDSSILKLKHSNSSINGMIWNLQNEILAFSNSGDVVNFNFIDNNKNEILINSLESLSSIHKSFDNKILAYSDSSDVIRLYNLFSGVPFGDLKANSNITGKILFSPDASLLAGSDDSGKMYIWRISDRKLIHEIDADDICVNDFEWNADGSLLITAGKSGSLRIWNSNDKKLIKQIINFGTEILDVTLSSNNFNLAVLTSQNNIDIYDFVTYFKLTSFKGNTSRAKAIEFSGDIKYLLEIGFDNIVYLRQTSNIQNIWQKYDLLNQNITSFDWSYDSKSFAIGGNNGDIHIVPVDALPLKRYIIQEDETDQNFTIIEQGLKLKFVNMGNVKLGSVKDTLIISYLVNSGIYPILIDSLFITGENSSAFEIMNEKYNLNVSPNNDLPIDISFKPIELGQNIATINAQVQDYIYSTEIIGNGIIPDAFLETFIIDFNQVNIDVIKDSSAIVLHNISDNSIFIDSVKIVGPDLNQFLVEDISAFEIASSETKKLQLKFAPIDLGRTSSRLAFYFDSPLSPIFSNLFGEGTAPLVEIKDSIYHEAICPEDNIMAIQISNQGNGNLVLKELNILGRDFNSVDFVQDYSFTEIEPNQFKEIFVILNSEEPKLYDFDLEIVTNRNSNNNQNFLVNVNILKNSQDLELNKQTIELLNLDRDKEYFDTVIVRNIGSLPLSFNLPIRDNLFEIIEIIPSVIPSGDSAIVIVKFYPSDNDGVFSESLMITTICNQPIFINATAYVGVNLSEISVLSYPVFENIYCPDQKDTSFIVVQNIGKSPLIIYEIENNNTEDFEIITDFTDRILLPEEKDSIFVAFHPLSAGVKNAKLNLNSNSIENNSLDVFLIAEQLSSDFELSISEIIMNDILNLFKSTNSISLKNNGVYSQNFELDLGSNFFSLNNYSIENLFANQSEIIEITFNGGLAGNQYFDTLIVSNQCGEFIKVPIYVNVRGYAHVGLMIGNHEAKSSEIVSIPIEIYSPENIELPKVDIYTTRICFNKTLLFPINQSLNGDIIGNLRCLDLELVNNGSNVLTEIDFYAMKGNTYETIIEISNSQAKDTNGINIEEKSGSFKLLDKDSTLFGGDEKLFLGINNPNPAINLTKIEFEIIESGNHKIILFDNLGREVAEIYDNNINPGRYNVEFDVSSLSQGFYVYKLFTPSITLSRKMLIIK